MYIPSCIQWPQYCNRSSITITVGAPWSSSSCKMDDYKPIYGFLCCHQYPIGYRKTRSWALHAQDITSHQGHTDPLKARPGFDRLICSSSHWRAVSCSTPQPSLSLQHKNGNRLYTLPKSGRGSVLSVYNLQNDLQTTVTLPINIGTAYTWGERRGDNLN